MKSEGCIMVSDEAMIEIDNLIQSRNKRVLIYSFQKIIKNFVLEIDRLLLLNLKQKNIIYEVSSDNNSVCIRV